MTKGKERIGIQFKVPERKKDGPIEQTPEMKINPRFETPKLFECETRIK